MFRIIRTTTLQALRDDVAEADQTASAYNAEAEKWHRLYTDEVQRADDAEQAADHTAELRGEDREHYEQQIANLRTELVEARRSVEDNSSVLAEMRADLDQIRAAAADPEHGESVRAAIAYGVLRDAYDDVRSRGEVQRLGREWDLLSVVLGFDADRDSAPASTVPVEMKGGTS
jgi:DNA repair exonuclease SbcCD ATPase subunit